MASSNQFSAVKAQEILEESEMIIICPMITQRAIWNWLPVMRKNLTVSGWWFTISVSIFPGMIDLFTRPRIFSFSGSQGRKVSVFHISIFYGFIIFFLFLFIICLLWFLLHYLFIIIIYFCIYYLFIIFLELFLHITAPFSCPWFWRWNTPMIHVLLYCFKFSRKFKKI